MTNKVLVTAADVLDYEPLLDGVHIHFNSVTSWSENTQLRLFHTKPKTDDMFQLYLDNIPSEYRQHHNCHTCKAFIRRFGGLVSLGANGAATSAMWQEERVPNFYQPAVKALREAAENGTVDNVAVFTDRVLGTPETGEWTHFAVVLPDRIKFTPAALVGEQLGKTAENFKTVSMALADFKPDMLRTALTLLNSEQLVRPEKFIGPVQWLLDIHEKRGLTKNQETRRRILWHAIATAPEGFCHPRQSMIGSLLEDIQAGFSFEVIKRRFNSKLGPLDYQRAKAAPTAGNIVRAEKLVERLGIAPSLPRRFLRPNEALPRCIWTPKVMGTPVDEMGVFGHLKPKNAERPPAVLNIPPITMTWEKFCQKILPTAQKIKYLTESVAAYCALTTAVNMDAPPIIKWDDPEDRNPVSWYGHHPRNSAVSWKLRSYEWVNVYGVVPYPTLWGKQPMPFLGEGVILLLENMHDAQPDQGGAALFPEILRSELHEVRSTVEAYSNSASIAGGHDPAACGISIGKNSKSDRQLEVTADGITQRYTIDRWE